ncbi:hypothetical protein NT05HA_0624 [Aggregatibacter aphrophilus NJ8700]|nr:hypothetical protein NT05HA_0624 [Aggregatibacter aphrophilus NJ8700]
MSINLLTQKSHYLYLPHFPLHYFQSEYCCKVVIMMRILSISNGIDFRITDWFLSN